MNEQEMRKELKDARALATRCYADAQRKQREADAAWRRYQSAEAGVDALAKRLEIMCTGKVPPCTALVG